MFQYAGLSLVGPSSSFWIGSHIGCDTAPSSPAIAGSAKNHLFFIIINRTHMHRHMILLQCVDLNNTYRPSFIIDASLPQNGSHASCYAWLCQGLHGTATKSDHLLGRSAPRTYSTICISSESCLGSLVGFARLPCFGTLCSVLSAKVAPRELLRLCPGSAGRAPR